jgi:hypothetical protein
VASHIFLYFKELIFEKNSHLLSLQKFTEVTEVKEQKITHANNGESFSPANTRSYLLHEH